MDICSVHGCDKAKYCRGYCTLHYSRLRRHGNVNVNYSFRIYRVNINDNSTFDKGYISAKERQVLSELFYGGKHQGALKINMDEYIGFGED